MYAIRSYYGGRKLKSFFSVGWFPLLFAILIPLVNGVVFAMLSSVVTDDVSNRFMFAILAVITSYSIHYTKLYDNFCFRVAHSYVVFNHKRFVFDAYQTNKNKAFIRNVIFS